MKGPEPDDGLLVGNAEPTEEPMPKSGRERKAKRRARKAAEKAAADAGAGDHWEHGDRQSNALIAQSLRWHTDATGEEQTFLNKAATKKALKARELAVLMTRRLMLSNDPKVANAAVRNLLTMERQNQIDQIGDEGRKPAEGVLAGANIQQAQIVITVPDNGRGGVPAAPVLPDQAKGAE